MRSPFVVLLSVTGVLGLMCSSLVSAQVGTNQTLLDPNIAELAELGSLPQLGPEAANVLVAARPILSVSQLDTVLSAALNAEQRNELYSRLFRQIDLNSASREEIMLIHGMSSRMAHEFEEYRPWRSYAQFDKEIGKYVDAKEVKRLWRYVTIQ